MAGTSYFTIQDDLANALRDDPQQRLAGATIVIESNDPMADATPYITVFLENRSMNERRIADSKPYDVTVRFSVWAYQHSAKDFADACRLRDETLQVVEQVLRDNRKFSSHILTSTVTGGDFETAQVGGGFWAGGSVIVEALVRA